MKAFLLAAGFGERLRPLTHTVPKPLVPVAGIPLVCYALALVRQAGIESVLCNVHYRGRDIIDFFDRHDRFGFDLVFSEEETILGTGGGLKRCESLLSEGPFLLVNSDIITDFDVQSLVTPHGDGDAAVTLALVPGGAAKPVSVRGGRVVDMRGLNGSGIPGSHDYAGLARVGPPIFPLLSEGYSDIVQSAFAPLAAEGQVGYVEHRGFWGDCGTPGALTSLEEYLLSKRQDIIERAAHATGFRPGTC